MATTSLWAIRTTDSKSARAVVKQLVEYAENEEKTTKGKQSSFGNEKHSNAGNGQKVVLSSADDQSTVQSVLGYMADKNEGMRYVSGINCNPETAAEEMITTRTRWTVRGNRVAYHGYQSFLPGEGTPGQVHQIGVELARSLWGDRFEVVVATHLDRAHLHNHFLINAVSFLDGKKFVWDTEFPQMQARSDEICQREGLSILDNSLTDRKRSRGAIRAENEGRPTLLSILKEDIDSCIAVSSTIEEWMEMMVEKGYRLDLAGRYLKVFPYGHKKAIRIERRFGEEYSLSGIEEQIRNHAFASSDVELTEDAQEKVYQIVMLDTDSGVEEKSPAIEANSSSDIPRHPQGIQATYIGFLVKIGFQATKGRIARTHYLLREELTKLDRYIEESKFLIREGIRTEKELMDRQKMDRKESVALSRNLLSCKRKLARLGEKAGTDDLERRDVLRREMSALKQRQMKVRDDLKNEKNILQRMGEMRRKVAKVEALQQGKNIEITKETMRCKERSGSHGFRRENS